MIIKIEEILNILSKAKVLLGTEQKFHYMCICISDSIERIRYERYIISEYLCNKLRDLYYDKSKEESASFDYCLINNKKFDLYTDKYAYIKVPEFIEIKKLVLTDFFNYYNNILKEGTTEIKINYEKNN